LLEIGDLTPFENSSESFQVLQFLRRQLKIEEDIDIKVVIVGILGKLALDPGIDAEIIIEDLLAEVIFAMFSS
jgi:hypothetical protein